MILLKCDVEDSWESLGLQGDQTDNPKGNQPWIFIGRTDDEDEAPKRWSPDEKSWLTGKDPDAGKDWGQEAKGTTEDEMFGQHHQSVDMSFEQALGDGEGQGSLYAAVHVVTNSQIQLSNWTTTTSIVYHNLQIDINITKL